MTLLFYQNFCLSLTWYSGSTQSYPTTKAKLELERQLYYHRLHLHHHNLVKLKAQFDQLTQVMAKKTYSAVVESPPSTLHCLSCGV